MRPYTRRGAGRAWSAASSSAATVVTSCRRSWSLVTSPVFSTTSSVPSASARRSSQGLPPARISLALTTRAEGATAQAAQLRTCRTGAGMRRAERGPAGSCLPPGKPDGGASAPELDLPPRRQATGLPPDEPKLQAPRDGLRPPSTEPGRNVPGSWQLSGSAHYRNHRPALRPERLCANGQRRLSSATVTVGWDARPMPTGEALSRDFYANLGAEGLRQRTRPEWDAAITELTAAYVERRERVLDVGCGYGRIAIPLAARGYQVTGLDLSEPLLRSGRTEARAQGARLPLGPRPARSGADRGWPAPVRGRG